MASLFIGCDSQRERANIFFYYPAGRLHRDPDEVADNLQAAFDLMAAQFPAPTGVDYQCQFSGRGKIVIGYRRGKQHAGDGRPVDEGVEICAGYYAPERRINIPWDLLDSIEKSHGFDVNVEFQPEYCCGHEMGHLFESVYLDGSKNQEEWKEGVCDFTRILLLKEWARKHGAFASICDQYEHYIMTVDPTGKSNDSNERRYHFAAQLVLKYFRHNGRDLCFAHLRPLFDGDMTAMLGTWRA
jgi:hypothetical protein